MLSLPIYYLTTVIQANQGVILKWTLSEQPEWQGLGADLGFT